jgi:KDO2-lipid IV(A) lauroyltransferase
MSEVKKRRKRHKRKKTKVEFFIHYLIIRAVIFFVMLMPVQRSLNFAAFLGRCLWKHYKRGKIRAIDNLRASYPNETEQWYESVGKRSFEQVVMLVIDILYTPKLVRKDNWREFSHFTNTEYAKWIIHEHKGALMVTGHYGNFEIVGYMLGLFGFDINSVARPLDNPYMNDYLYGVRERHGQKILNKKGASNEFGDILQSGATLGFIGDQDAGSRGIFVDFFGRKASAYKSIAIAALYYNVPIIIGITRRVENRFFFEVELEQIIMPADWKDKDDPIRWVSQEYNSALERAIRKDPTQYWWLHRRWKTRPKNELAQE